jgi:hypothetical protein
MSKRNRTIAIDIDLEASITEKVGPTGFSALVDSLLREWDRKAPKIPKKAITNLEAKGIRPA